MRVAFLTILLSALLAAPASGANRLGLVRGYAIPAGDPAAAGLADRAWTYDSALAATAYAATGEPERARPLLDRLAALQRPDGALDFSFDVRTGEGSGLVRSGAIAWVGLAAAQYRGATCSGRYDTLMEGVARWLLARRGQDGLVRGGSDVGWASTEHNLEARGFLAALARLAGGDAGCPGGLDGRAAAGFAAELRGAVAALDAGIDRELLADDRFRQGVGDDVLAVDAQAFGILWLLGQGRDAEAARVEAHADAHLARDGGYRPYAGGGMPDVVWSEGTLQMRFAKAALGADTRALDAAAAAWPSAGELVRHADRDTGEYRTWLAAAPGAWLGLSRSGFALLGR